MTLFYGAAFNVATLTLGNLTLTRSGQADCTIALSSMTSTQASGSGTSGIYFHGPSNTIVSNQHVVGQDPGGTIKLQNYANRSFPWALETELEAQATAVGWPDPSAISVTRSDVTGFYTISIIGNIYAVGITFSLAAGASLLGFSGLSFGAANSRTGTLMPTYLIAPTLQAVSEPTTNYEPRSISNHAETDNGSGFGIARTVSPLYRDWLQQFETKEKTLRLSAVSSHPWTFQDLYEHCRGRFAFQTIDTDGQELFALSEVFSFRGDESRFEPQRATPGNDSQFHMSFRTVVEGTMTAYTP